MRNLFSILLLLGLTAFRSAGQGFEKIYPILSTHQYAPTEIVIANTGDGGFLVAVGTGFTDYQVNTDVTLLRLDAAGDTLWTKVIGSEYFDWISGIASTSDGHFLLTGVNGYLSDVTCSVTLVWLLKMDANGNVLWEKNIDPSWFDGYAENVFEVGEGAIVIGGHARFLWEESAFMMRLDAEGNLKWTEFFPDFESPEISVMKNEADEFFFGGGTYNPNGGDFYRLLKADVEGNKLWVKNFTVHPYSSLNTPNLAPAENGGLFFTATDFDLNTGDEEGVVLKISAAGILQKKKFYSPADFFASVATWDGGLVVAGYPAKIWRMDENGDSLFTLPLNNWFEPNYVQSILKTADGQLLVAGTKHPQNDLYLLKTGGLDIASEAAEEIDFQENIVFPNPTSGLFSLNVDVPGQARLELTDCTGGVVLKRELNLSEENALDISSVPSGVYFIKVQTPAQMLTGKILKVSR